MKFKNIKKKKYVKKSPSNSRTITASPNRGETEPSKFSFPKISSIKLVKLYREALKIFVVVIFVVASTVVGYDLKNNLQIKQSIDSQREILVHDLNFWENFVSTHKNYRDAYFQASILEYKLGDKSKAKMYFEKGLSLDPSSIDGGKLEQFFADK